MLSLLISYLFISLSSAICPYISVDGIPTYPVGQCIEERDASSTVTGTKYLCFGAYQNGTTVLKSVFLSGTCNDDADTDLSSNLFIIGDNSTYSINSCSGTCPDIARVKKSECMDETSCATNCDGPYEIEKFVLNECFITETGSSQYTCTNSKVYRLQFSDNSCTMDETDGIIVAKEGCGTGNDANIYFQIEECPLDDSVKHFSLSAGFILVLVILSYIF